MSPTLALRSAELCQYADHRAIASLCLLGDLCGRHCGDAEVEIPCLTTPMSGIAIPGVGPDPYIATSVSEVETDMTRVASRLRPRLTTVI